MEMKENYKTPKWFYRSDDRPMENIGIHEKWTIYNDSDLIETNFQKYLDSLKDKAMNPYEIFNLNLTYYIDFKENVQINKNDPLKQRLVGRFQGNSKNTLND